MKSEEKKKSNSKSNKQNLVDIMKIFDVLYKEEKELISKCNSSSERLRFVDWEIGNILSNFQSKPLTTNESDAKKLKELESEKEKLKRIIDVTYTMSIEVTKKINSLGPKYLKTFLDASTLEKIKSKSTTNNYSEIIPKSSLNSYDTNRNSSSENLDQKNYSLKSQINDGIKVKIEIYKEQIEKINSKIIELKLSGSRVTYNKVCSYIQDVFLKDVSNDERFNIPFNRYVKIIFSYLKLDEERKIGWTPEKLAKRTPQKFKNSYKNKSS